MKPYISDYHVHSHHSDDSEESVQNIIDTAIRLGMKSICFTDHMDYDFPDTEEGLTFNLDIPKYTKEICDFCSKYSDRINLNVGIELGMQEHIATENDTIVKSYPFDFVIASTHVIDHSDPYYKSFWDNRSVDKCLKLYFESILNCIKEFNNYDVYGHLDYIIRYIPDKSITFSYKDYADVIDEILRTIIKNGKGIEANTAGFRYGLGMTNPSLEILKRYKELGGEIITIGSDAHKASYVGGNFLDARNILLEAGFKHYNIFSKRHCIACDL